MERRKHSDTCTTFLYHFLELLKGHRNSGGSQCSLFSAITINCRSHGGGLGLVLYDVFFSIYPYTIAHPTGASLAGPTATGKSSIALALCKSLGGEIVSCDSVQVYTDVCIGCNKPSDLEMREVPHHLVGVASLDETFTAGEPIPPVSTKHAPPLVILFPLQNTDHRCSAFACASTEYRAPFSAASVGPRPVRVFGPKACFRKMMPTPGHILVQR